MELTVRGATVEQGQKGSTQAMVTFPNGYQASVISDGYGTDDGLYEIAVMHNGQVDYSTPITSDVIGYLTEQDVIDTCAKIGDLPHKTKTLGQSLVHKMGVHETSFPAC